MKVAKKNSHSKLQLMMKERKDSCLLQSSKCQLWRTSNLETCIHLGTLDAHLSQHPQQETWKQFSQEQACRRSKSTSICIVLAQDASNQNHVVGFQNVINAPTICNSKIQCENQLLICRSVSTNPRRRCFYKPIVHVMYNGNAKAQGGAIYTIKFSKHICLCLYLSFTVFSTYCQFTIIRLCLKNTLPSNQESPTNAITVRFFYFFIFYFVLNFKTNWLNSCL